MRENIKQNKTKKIRTGILKDSKLIWYKKRD